MSAIANQAKSTFYRGQVGPQGPRGPQGEKGDRGDRGDRGANGAQGVGILDATVDANGLLIVTLQDATTIVSNSSLIGPQGTSIVNMYIDENNDLQVGLTNGEIFNAGYVKGDQGEVGPQGQGIVLLESVDSIADLGSIVDPKLGDIHFVVEDGNGYVWNNTGWISVGPIQGPIGDTGEKGNAATITVGEVTASEPGGAAVVVNSGDSNVAVFDFTIPRGERGDSWEDASYDPITGKVTFKTGDGYEFETEDLRAVKLVIQGRQATLADLQSITGVDGDAWLVTEGAVGINELHLWIGGQWENLGQFVPSGSNAVFENMAVSYLVIDNIVTYNSIQRTLDKVVDTPTGDQLFSILATLRSVRSFRATVNIFANNGTADVYQILDFNAIHNGQESFMSQSNDISTGENLAEFNVTYSSSAGMLLNTKPVYDNTKFTVVITTIRD